MNTSGKRNVGAWATGGAVVAAVLSSACCWLPLLLIAFGASAVGVSGFFEAYRPHLLVSTGILLALGFYLIYFHKKHCEPGSSCAVPNARLTRINKVMLWAASGCVLAFALFPNYVGLLIGGGENQGATSTLSPGASRLYRIEGMTCEACTNTIQAQVAQVPGVIRSDVSFKAKTARVFLGASGNAPSDSTILKAIEQVGYRATPVPGRCTIRIKIEGMTCEGCASGIAAHLRALSHVRNAKVSYADGFAEVALSPNAEIQVVLDAIQTQGYHGQVVKKQQHTPPVK